MDKHSAVIVEREGEDEHVIFFPKADVSKQGVAVAKARDNIKEARPPFPEAAFADGVDRSLPKP